MSGETLSSSVSSTIDNLLSPAILFFILNLMIASIAISSKLTSSDDPTGDPEAEEDHKHQHRLQHKEEEEEEEDEQPISNFNPDPPTEPLSRTRSSLGTFRFIDVGCRSMRHRQENQESPKVEHSQLIEKCHTREEICVYVMGNDAMKENHNNNNNRSFSIRSTTGDTGRCQRNEEIREDAEERRRPAREFKEEDEEAEVDARADDFINRFKQQLKLQRIESLKRCRAAMGLS